MFPISSLKPLTNHSTRKGWLVSKWMPVLALTIILFGFTAWVAAPAYTSSRSAPSRSAASAQSTQQATNVWTSHGPEGAAITSLVIDPTNPQILYAGSRGLTPVYKSTDSGASWVATSLPGVFCPSLAINPRNSNILYAMTAHDIYKSTDGGATWQAADNGLGSSLHVFRIVLLAPSQPDSLYADIGFSQFKSTDGGASWKHIRDDFIALLTIDPTNSDTLYGSVLYESGMSGLVKSTDGGINIQELNTGQQGFPFRLAIDPHNSNVLYAASDPDAVEKSTDGGASWLASDKGLPDIAYCTALAVDPGNANTIYAAFPLEGVFRSTDAGASWSEFNAGLPTTYVSSLALEPTGTHLYAGTPNGVFDYQFSTGCADALSSTEQAFPFEGGSGSVEVSAGSDCQWTAISNAAWLTVTSESSGKDTTTINFSVAVNNTNIHPRITTLLIGGRILTITQAGAPLRISDARLIGKALYVDVENFDPGGVILINGVALKTAFADCFGDCYPNTTLVASKAGKKIAHGQSVKLQVRNPNGALSPEFTFTRE